MDWFFVAGLIIAVFILTYSGLHSLRKREHIVKLRIVLGLTKSTVLTENAAVIAGYTYLISAAILLINLIVMGILYTSGSEDTLRSPLMYCGLGIAAIVFVFGQIIALMAQSD